jgi:hypothetical protein
MVLLRPSFLRAAFFLLPSFTSPDYAPYPPDVLLEPGVPLRLLLPEDPTEPDVPVEAMSLTLDRARS